MNEHCVAGILGSQVQLGWLSQPAHVDSDLHTSISDDEAGQELVSVTGFS